MSKNPKPTGEELKFVYDLILKGNSDSDILEEYSQLYDAGTLMFPYRTDKRFIRERRKELDLVLEILQNYNKKILDPIILENRKKHYEHLAEIANTLWPININVVPNIEDSKEPLTGDCEYLVGEYESADTGPFNLKQLSNMLEENHTEALQRFGIKCVDQFEKHFNEEIADRKPENFQSMMKNHPFQTIEILTTLSQRGTFKGKCSICKDW